MTDGDAVPLIVLPGALGPLEAGAPESRLGPEQAVRAIDYRAGDRLGPLIARIVAAADGDGRFDLLGQSYGGWIAQCVARAHPGRVRRLVLSHSFALERRDRWRFRLGRAMIRRLPVRLLSGLLAGRVRTVLAPVAARDPALAGRLAAMLTERMGEPEFRAVLAAQQACLADSLAEPFTSRPPSPDLPVLIIDSDEDPIVPLAAREKLRSQYPGAEVRRFPGAGHVSALAEPEAYWGAVAAFLR
jgi:pimeloyl-ACP methyl ester carboxylesterase